MNVDTVSIDLSQWVFKDGIDDHEFIVPNQTIIDTGQFLVLCQDTGKFKNIYTDVQNIIGPFGFGLAHEGEQLRLFDNTGMLVVSTLYSNQEPWPTDADGTGKTIELFDPYGDLNDGNNWFSGCIGGSPGGPFIECDTVGVYNINDPVSGFKVYPNPFNVFTTIEFYLEAEQEINFEVFDTFGNLILKKHIYYSDQGIKRFTINRTDMEPGVYFYKIHFQDIIHTGKLLVR